MQSSGVFCSSWHIFTPFFPVSDAKIWVFEGLRARQTLQWRLNPQALKIYIILNQIMQTVDVLWRHSDVFLWCYAISSSVSERRGERKYPNKFQTIWKEFLFLTEGLYGGKWLKTGGYYILPEIHTSSCQRVESFCILSWEVKAQLE